MQNKEEPKLLPESQTNIADFAVPEDLQALDELVKRAKIPPINNLGQGYLGSGSKLTQKQFAALRIIFPRIQRVREFDDATTQAVYGLDRVWDEAVRLVTNCPEFQAYLQLVLDKTAITTVRQNSPNWPGSLKPVLFVQEQVMTVGGVHDRVRDGDDDGTKHQTRSVTARLNKLGRPLTRTIRRLRSGSSREMEQPSPEIASIDVTAFPDAEDETTPNVALILFLQAISDLVLNSKLEWVFNHVHFCAKFCNGYFNVYTDGALRSTTTQSIMGIVEVKRRMRYKEQDRILMQEGAEMVGWLLNSRTSQLPKLNNRRLLISQDRHFLYVTFASCHEDYLNYLDSAEGKGQITQNSFLEMKTCGPWMLNNAPDMRKFAILIVALTLLAKDAVEEMHPEISNVVL